MKPLQQIVEQSCKTATYLQNLLCTAQQLVQLVHLCLGSVEGRLCLKPCMLLTPPSLTLLLQWSGKACALQRRRSRDVCVIWLAVRWIDVTKQHR